MDVNDFGAVFIHPLDLLTNEHNNHLFFNRGVLFYVFILNSSVYIHYLPTFTVTPVSLYLEVELS